MATAPGVAQLYLEEPEESKESGFWAVPTSPPSRDAPGSAPAGQGSPQGTWQSHSQMSQRWNQRAQADSLVTQAEILTQPRLRAAPRCVWLPQDEEHLPPMSRSLISMRPRRQIPAGTGAGAEPMRGARDVLQPRWRPALYPPVLTEAGGPGAPAAVGLAGAGGVPQQEEAGPAAVAHHGAHPPVIAVHHRVPVRLGPPAVHCGHGWERGGQPGRPQGSPRQGCGCPGLCPRAAQAAGGTDTPECGTKPCGVPRDPPEALPLQKDL